MRIQPMALSVISSVKFFEPRSCSSDSIGRVFSKMGVCQWSAPPPRNPKNSPKPRLAGQRSNGPAWLDIQSGTLCILPNQDVLNPLNLSTAPTEPALRGTSELYPGYPVANSVMLPLATL